MSESADVTQLLIGAAAGESPAVDRLFGAIYTELRGLAERKLQGERPDHTLQPTDLVHEAYLRLIDQTRCDWKNRAHFFAIAAQAMRRILVDYARQRGRQKRGGGWERVTLEEVLNLSGPEADTALLDLDEALDKLASVQPEKARLVEMRFFAGLTTDECAAALGVASRTVERHWQYAQAWLYRELTLRPREA